MNRVTITLTIDLPDGVIPDVAYGTPEEPPDLRELANQVFSQEIKAPEPKLDTDARVSAAPAPFPPFGASAPVCSTHGTPMVRWPAGTNKQGKPYNASWRCPVKDCPTKPLWDRDAG